MKTTKRFLLTIILFLWMGFCNLFSQTDNIAVNLLNTTDNFITVSNSEDFDFMGSMSVEAWIKVDHFDKPYAAIVTKGSHGWGLERWGSTNFLQFRAGNDSVQGSISVNDGLWHHVAGIYLNAYGISLIIDGVVDAHKSLLTPATPNNEYPVVIGDNAQKPGRYFYGQMDEVRIWRYFRSAQQISDNINVELTGNETDLITYYRMNHIFDQPSHLFDYTEKGHTGILDNTNGNYQVWSGVIFEQAPSEGDGSAENPYQIDSIAELFWITQHTDAWDKNFVQTGNIDATDTESLYGGQGMIPVGNATTKFTGNFDGGDFTIDGLFINRPDEDYAGIFGYAYNSDLSNIRLTNADITGQNWVGGIAGLLSYYSTITKSALSGNVTGTDKVGGMAGQANYGSSVQICTNTATITGENQVGGIAGDTWSSVLVNRCYNTGTITGTGTDCGGISGYNHSNSNLFNSYNSGTVSGNNAAGGIAGNSSAFIDKCYSTGVVSASTLSGGLLGTGFGTVFNSFWDTETSGQGSSYGGTGKTTAQMKNINTYTLVNELDLWTAWDFVGESANGTEDIWDIDGTHAVNNGYPFLSWQPTVMTWSGSAGTSWDNAGNWSGSNSVPTSVKSIIIPDVDNNPVIGTAVEVAGLSVQSGGELTIAYNGSLTVNGTLTNNAGNSGLIVQSNTTGTGSLLHYTENVPATVQRDIQAASWSTWTDGWHFVSSPVANQEINADNGWVTSGADNDFDLYSWSEPNGEWINFKNTTEPPTFLEVNGSISFASGKGYLVAYQQSGTKQFSGNLNVESLTVSNLNITGATDVLSWHLLGNPYPCALVWNNWEKSGIGGTLQVWNEALQDYSPLTQGVSTIIPATNGFMVEVTQDNASITIPTTARTHSDQSWYKSTEANTLKLTARAADNSSGKETIIRFNHNSTEGFDVEYDGHYLRGFGPVFYSLAGSEQLSVNTLPMVTNTTEIPLVFQKNDKQDYILQAEGVSSFSTDIQLVDLKTGLSQHLKQNPEYTFNASEGDDYNRFLLIFSPVGMTESSENELMHIYAYGKTLTVLNPENLHGSIQILNIPGQQVRQQSINGETFLRMETDLSSGVYIISIVSSKGIINKKIIIQ